MIYPGSASFSNTNTCMICKNNVCLVFKTRFDWLFSPSMLPCRSWLRLGSNILLQVCSFRILQIFSNISWLDCLLFNIVSWPKIVDDNYSCWKINKSEQMLFHCWTDCKKGQHLASSLFLYHPLRSNQNNYIQAGHLLDLPFHGMLVLHPVCLANCVGD